MIQFRVWARPVEGKEGDEFILEQYGARSDAEKFYASLQTDEDNILESVPFGAVVISLEEFHNGQWTRVGRKLVGLR